MINRRGLITGLISLAAAPAIVRASSLMPVKVIKPYITMQDYINMMAQCRIDILYEQMTDLVVYGQSIVRIEHDPNTPDGIVFTPIHNYLKLDKSVPTIDLEQPKKDYTEYALLRKSE